MIVIEGTEAGGHLGFKPEELEEGNKPKLEDITKDVVNYIKFVLHILLLYQHNFLEQPLH